MSISPVNYSPEETVRLLSERAKTSTDRFVVKISRRRGMAGLLEHIATLTEATVNHIANPETWLPNLCGGGDYGLQVAHMDEVSARLGGVLAYKFQGVPSDRVKVEVLQHPNWNGPGAAIFPAATDSGLPNGNAGATMSGPASLPGQPVAGYGFPPHLSPGNQGVPGFQPFYDERVERERERLARESRELAEARAKTDATLKEREFELRSKEREAKITEDVNLRQRALEEKMREQAASKTDFKDILAALAPVIATMFQTQAQARADQARMQEESSRRFMEMMQMQQAQTQAMMMKFAEPKGVDPTVTTMMEMMRANSQGGAEMMTRIVDAMGTVSKTSVGMIEAIADLQLGGTPEHPILSAVREGVRAMATLSQGAQKGAQTMVNGSNKAAQTQQQLPAQASPAPAQQQARPKNGAAGAQVVHEAPGGVPPPNHPPATENAAFGDGPTANPFGQPIEGQVISRVKELIEAHSEPVEAVADFFLNATATKELRDQLAKHGGDFGSLVGEHLGLWAMADEANREYLGRLGVVIERMGIERGLFAPDEPESDEDESDEAAE